MAAALLEWLIAQLQQRGYRLWSDRCSLYVRQYDYDVGYVYGWDDTGLSMRTDLGASLRLFQTHYRYEWCDPELQQRLLADVLRVLLQVRRV